MPKTFTDSINTIIYNEVIIPTKNYILKTHNIEIDEIDLMESINMNFNQNNIINVKKTVKHSTDFELGKTCRYQIKNNNDKSKKYYCGNTITSGEFCSRHKNTNDSKSNEINKIVKCINKNRDIPAQRLKNDIYKLDCGYIMEIKKLDVKNASNLAYKKDGYSFTIYGKVIGKKSEIIEIKDIDKTFINKTFSYIECKSLPDDLKNFVFDKNIKNIKDNNSDISSNDEDYEKLKNKKSKKEKVSNSKSDSGPKMIINKSKKKSEKNELSDSDSESEIVFSKSKKNNKSSSNNEIKKKSLENNNEKKSLSKSCSSKKYNNINKSSDDLIQESSEEEKTNKKNKVSNYKIDFSKKSNNKLHLPSDDESEDEDESEINDLMKKKV